MTRNCVPVFWRLSIIHHDMGRAVFREKNRLLNILLPASFVLVFFLQVNVVFVIVGSAAVSLAAGLVSRRRKRDGAAV